MAPRRPRDIDAELRALQDKARQLRTRQKAQLGELLLATGAADALDPDALAGLLLHGLEQAKANPKAAESWRQRGEAFSPRRKRHPKSGSGQAAAADAGAAPADPADAARLAAE
ncbi:conjugal transfer protein TraD [Pseudoroseomonas wenyumeiae]